MKKFKYQLNSLLNYRENRRDVCRQALAQVLAADQELVQQKQRVQKEYQAVEREIKELGRGGMVDVDKISARRFHLGHLNLQIRIIDENRRQLEERINLCRQAVIESDQDVKVLEKIKTRKQEEHNREQIHHENLEREEAWRAAQW